MVTPSRWIAASMVVALIGTSLPVSAEEPPAGEIPSAALVGFRTGKADLDVAVRRGLTDRLDRSGRLQTLPDEEVAQAVTDVWAGDKGEAAASVEQAYKDFQEGKRLYGRLALEEAVRVLSASVRGYREGIAALRDNRFLLLSHLYLGIALIILGKESEGRKYIHEMVVLDPSRKSRKLSPREFSPKILGIHKELTDEVLRGPTGRLVVETRPPGAQVIFDGVVQKAAPLRIDEVPVGEHFMVAEMDGYRQYSRRVVVGAGENLVTVALSEWQPFSPYSQARRADLANLELLGQTAEKLKARVLLLGEVVPAGESEVSVTAQLFDSRTREFSRIESVGTAPAKAERACEELARRLLRNLSADGSVSPESMVPTQPTERFTVGPETEPTPSPSRDGRKGIAQQWWFWTALALLVVGGGIGAYFAFRPDPNHTVINVGNPFYAQ